MTNRDLGMNRPITRRDFVGGVATAISGSLLWKWSEAQASEASYPPVLTGMRGSHEGSFEVAHKMRDGVRWDRPEESGEEYDLVVVGGGLSGLAAAWYFREARPDASILILDNHDDFGGHAKRNEFWHGDRLLLSFGGTQNIQDLKRYDQAGRRLIEALGIDVARYPEFNDKAVYGVHGMQRGVFLGKEMFGVDRLLAVDGYPSWHEFLAKAPLSDTAREDLARVYESNIDYLDGLSPEEKVGFLQRTSYQAFLLETVGIGEEAVSYLWRSSTWAIGMDAISAWVATGEGWPGTGGLGLDNYSSNGATTSAEAQFCQFPDGNATIARLLVRSLVPGVAAGSTLDDVVTARFDYSALDSADARVHIRLESTAVNVRHRGTPNDAGEVEVTYVRGDRAIRVRGRHCIMACYNAAIPHICEELPPDQKEALSLAVKAPLVTVNVLIRNWEAFAKLKVHRLRCPGSFFEVVALTEPLNIGEYRHSASPDEPVVLRMYRTPLVEEMRGQPAPDQWRAGRRELLTMTFEDFEREIRDQLGRMLGAGGFDPARDIQAITVNRWPHGYAYGHDPKSGQVAWMLDELPPERSPWIAARKPFGRIAIANSDAMADAMTEGAFSAANLAVSSIIADVD